MACKKRNKKRDVRRWFGWKDREMGEKKRQVRRGRKIFGGERWEIKAVAINSVAALRHPG